MKVLLSWLQRARARRRRRRRARRAHERPRARRRRRRPDRPARRRRRRREGAGAASPSRCQERATGRRGFRRRRAAAGVVRRVQHAGRRPCPARHGRYDDAQRHEDRPTQDPRRGLERHAVLTGGARHGHRLGRHPHPPEPTSRSALRCGRRWRSAPMWCSTSISPAIARTRISHAGVARDLAARLDVPLALPDPHVEVAAASEGVAVTIADPEGCGRFTAARHLGSACHRFSSVDRGAADPCGHASDQQRRRRVELRDARARAAQPHVRPRQAGGRRLRHPQGARGRDVLTLDGIERACSAATC